MTDPTNVHALVFGLGAYDYGRDMDLAGSARDAVRFARWVLDNGVPAEQVWVGLSSPDEQEPDGVLPDEVRTVGTTRDAVRRVFTEELTKHQGELLLVFWSGHGIVTTDRERVLFTSDMTSTSRLNVAVENLLTHLASTHVNFAHTIVIIDGCANFALQYNMCGRLPAETWDLADEQSGSQDQDVLLAAAQGQTAAPNHSERYGEFANAVLDTLAPPDAPPMGLPPDLDAVWVAVQAAMKALRDSGRTRQTPLRLERQHNRDTTFSATVGGDTAASSSPLDVLISYATSDTRWAKWIAWQLEQAGCVVSLQGVATHQRGDTGGAMSQLRRRHGVVIAVLSPAYLLRTSLLDSCGTEASVNPAAIEEERLLVAVRVAQCEPPALPGAVTYIDLVEHSEEQARAELIGGLADAAPRDRATLSPMASVSGPSPGFPGALPPVFNLPGSRAPLFVGRQRELAWLADRFGAQHPASAPPVTVALTGLGGVGKTQLAVEYAYAYPDRYDVVWWLRGQQAATAMADLAALVTEVGPHAPGLVEHDIEQAAVAGRRWLERHDHWLLVVDNVENLSDVHKLLPRSGGGHVLVTARSPVGWAEQAEVVPVDVLDEDSATLLLLKRTKDGDEQAARALAQALGGLALALQQAAGYVSESGGLGIAKYLELYGTRSHELLARGSPPGRDDTVATTWSLSLERMAESEPAAVALLELSAFMASEDLPIELLLAHPELRDAQLEAVADPIGRADALAALRRYGLGSVEAGLLSVHRVLQTVIRDGLSPKGRQRVSGLAVEVLAQAFPADVWRSPRTWPTAQLLVPHVLAATTHASDLGVAPQRTSWLLDRAGSYLHVIGQYNDALPLLERALSIIEGALGTDHIDVADRRNHLGELLRDLGKLAEARPLFEQALEASEVILEPDDPFIAAVRNNLGRAMLAAGDLEEANEHLALALVIAEDTFGPEDPIVGSYRNDLGAVLRERGELAAARREFEQALAISVAALGHDHPQVATRRSNLGRLLWVSGQLSAARDELEEALAISRAALGADHPQVAKRRNDLGMLLSSLGEFGPASEQLKLAVDVSQRVLGPEHPSVVEYRANLNSVLRSAD
jgi:tetratricopeptide (TPR) repeat protein